MKTSSVVAALFCVCYLPRLATSSDFLLTIGGGYAPAGNQASLEKNVLFYQRVLREKRLDPLPHAIYFADGLDEGKDLQVKDVGSIPRANRLMAEFFGSERELGVYYRNHEVPGVSDSASPVHIRQWFRDVGQSMQQSDRLIVYVTGHGKGSSDRRQPYDTSISLWNDESITMTEFVGLLDQLPQGVSVVAVMVQCYAGGFARFIYNEGDPDKGLSPQPRCGFFATLHDRTAAGCTPEIDEATYVEYSTYFWEAISGRTRSGEPIADPDYDGDGSVSFDEAHAYTVLKSDTIDLPIKTSGEFLSEESQFASDGRPDLLSENASYNVVLEKAFPSERAILESLSRELDLKGEGRIATARQESQGPRRGSRNRFRRGFSNQAAVQHQKRIADDLKRRWPALANVLNPGAIELLTTRSQTFVNAVEQHPDYRAYRAQADGAATRPDPRKRQVNGVVVHDVDQDDHETLKGTPLTRFICVQNHHSVVDFRRLQLKVLHQIP